MNAGSARLLRQEQADTEITCGRNIQLDWIAQKRSVRRDRECRFASEGDGVIRTRNNLCVWAAGGDMDGADLCGFWPELIRKAHAEHIAADAGMNHLPNRLIFQLQVSGGPLRLTGHLRRSGSSTGRHP